MPYAFCSPAAVSSFPGSHNGDWWESFYLLLLLSNPFSHVFSRSLSVAVIILSWCLIIVAMVGSSCTDAKCKSHSLSECHSSKPFALRLGEIFGLGRIGEGLSIRLPRKGESAYHPPKGETTIFIDLQWPKTSDVLEVCELYHVAPSQLSNRSWSMHLSFPRLVQDHEWGCFFFMPRSSMKRGAWFITFLLATQSGSTIISLFMTPNTLMVVLGDGGEILLRS